VPRAFEVTPSSSGRAETTNRFDHPATHEVVAYSKNSSERTAIHALVGGIRTMVQSINRGSAEPTSPRKAPERVTSATKVTVAFPFSQVRIEEPSEDVIALTKLVEDLAQCIADCTPSTKANELLRRAHELAARH
jgi:hypothetical protein